MARLSGVAGMRPSRPMSALAVIVGIGMLLTFATFGRLRRLRGAVGYYAAGDHRLSRLECLASARRTSQPGGFRRATFRGFVRPESIRRAPS